MKLSVWIAVAIGCVFTLSAAADTAPTITLQPETVMLAAATDPATFTATASGSPTPTVQWQYSTDRNGPWADVSGATDTTLTITPTPLPGYVVSLGNAFRAVFANAAGTVASRPARLVWRAEWMRDLRGDIGNVPLNQLTIPGTHDMGTYGITEDADTSVDGQIPDIACDADHDACVRWGEAQNPSANATGELEQGIRYFDLRVCYHGPDEFVTCHGLNAAPLADILSQTRAWIDEHPYEVVILDFNHHFETDVEAEAAQIEAAFALPGDGSLLIPPQYCTPGDPSSGTCADALTLDGIAASNLGRVIVNFENDDVEDSKIYVPTPSGDCAAFGLLTGPLGCFFYRQPPFGDTFYDNHPSFWGRTDPQPQPFSFSNEMCTTSGSNTSCFGGDPAVETVLGRVKTGLANKGYSHLFYVQFLQTTPDGGFIASNFGSSLDQMAHESNPIIGPALFGCDSSNPDCFFSEFHPENLNILPINFYNDTDYQVCTQFITPLCVHFESVHFDYVEEVIRFDEYARTAPVVLVNASAMPTAAGWYNVAILGGQGNPLHVNVTASDYRYSTGISSLACSDGAMSAVSLAPATNASSLTGGMDLHDGLHSLSCAATDGATAGFVGTGNAGVGPGSTAQPVTFDVDTVPPTITCGQVVLLAHQPAATVGAVVTDATSGPAASSLSGAVSTDAVGAFSVAFTAFDKAGNSTAGSCSYTVTYGIALGYDPTKGSTAGGTVAVTISLRDYFGTNVSSKSIAVTAVSVTNTATGTKRAPTGSGNANPGFAFITSPRGYVYALSTKGYTSGSYTLDFVVAGDPLTHHAPFMIR